jgi:membrane protein implicated in regulation of membrane protease activity
MRNVLVMWVLFVGVLCLAQDGIFTNSDALLLGISSGLAYGWIYWRRLSHRITREDRRFERNKVLVQFLSIFEIVLVGVAFSYYILIAFGILLVVGVFLAFFAGHWWSVFAGGFGVAAATLVGASIIWYERGHGPLYYQYDSRLWMGGEGMLYQVGEVTTPLTPTGTIMVNGELWRAVSLSGEVIRAGEQVEVISRDGLTLRVDRLPAHPNHGVG